MRERKIPDLVMCGEVKARPGGSDRDVAESTAPLERGGLQLAEGRHTSVPGDTSSNWRSLSIPVATPCPIGVHLPTHPCWGPDGRVGFRVLAFLQSILMTGSEPL
eukprot:g18352.t1